MEDSALINLKVRLGINKSHNDLLLRQLLDDAESFILGYTFRDESQWLPCFDAIARQIAVTNYARLDTEGIQSRTEGQISTTFSSTDDYPKNVVRQLDPYRLIRGLKA